MVTFDELLDEPLYQLMRQQLLAYEQERARAHGAERVRVVHVAPAANTDDQAWLQRPAQLALGSSVSEVWQKLLRHPDRFVSMDSSRLLDAEITSPSTSGGTATISRTGRRWRDADRRQPGRRLPRPSHGPRLGEAAVIIDQMNLRTGVWPNATATEMTETNPLERIAAAAGLALI